MGTNERFVGELELMVLLAVARLGEEARAADVRREIQARAGRKVARGALYVTLERLEDKGFVVWETEEPVPGRRGVPRRVFALTDAGLEALRVSHRAVASLAEGLRELLRS